MSTDVSSLAINVESRGLNQANEGLDRLAQTGARTEQRVTASTDNMRSRFQDLRRSIFSVQGMLASFGVGFTARHIINAVTEQEHVTRQLEAALVSTNGASRQTVAGMQALGAEMQRLTKFSNEQVEAAQGILLTFTKVSGETFPEAIRAAADLSTRMGTDLNTAIQQVGRALNDPILGLTALSRSGIQFTDVQRDMIRELVETNRTAEAQAIILQELETQFGGSAAAARDTLGGALAALRNEFDDLLKAIGQSGSGGLREAVEWLIENFHVVQRSLEVLAIIIGAKVVSSIIGMTAAAVANTTALVANEVAATRTAAAHGRLAAAARLSTAALRLLTGPAGIALTAGAALLYFRTRSTEASDTAEDLARNIRILRGDMESLRAEAIKTEMDKVQLAMTNTQAEIEKIARVWHRSEADMRELIKPHIEQLKVLGGQYAELAELLDKVGRQPPMTVEITGGATDSPKAIKEQIAALEQQAATFQMSEQGATLYKLALEGATQAELDHAAAVLDHIHVMERSAETVAERERGFASLKDAIEQETYALLTAEQQQMESYLRQLEQLEEYFDARGERTAEYYRLLEQMTDNHEKRMTQIATQEAQRRAQVEEQLQAQTQAMRMQTLSLSLGMLRELSGQSRGVALTLLAMEKSAAIASIYVQTKTAVMRAYAELGPIAGSAAAAKLTNLGYINMALVGATGLMQGASMGGGGGGGGVQSAPAPSAPLHQQDRNEREENQGVTQIHFHGDINGVDNFEDILRRILREDMERDAVVITGTTRQAYEFGGS